MERENLHTKLLILALTLLSCGACYGQDSKTVKSLASCLRTATNIGLIENEKHAGYTVIVYTSEQFARNLESLAKYKADLETYQTTVAAIDKRREVAVASKASIEQLNAITNERGSHQPPYSQFVQGRIALCRIVEVASDYLEISDIANTEDSTLIPLSKISSVRIKKHSVPRTENGSDK